MIDKQHRQNVLLKSGMGTVAAADYDESRHGPAVDETDEQYDARITGRVRPHAGPAGATHAPSGLTTIANLATFDPATESAPVAAVTPRPILSSPPPGRRVATVEAPSGVKADVKPGKP